MTVSDALKSILIFQLIACIVNIIFIETGNILTRAIRCIIGHFIGFILFTLILYCCGATILNKKWNRKRFTFAQLSYDLYILSTLLSSLTLMPVFIKHSFDTELIRKVIMDVKHKPTFSNNKALSYPFWCTIIGCILGSYILALDWFRPYQEFPLPCLMGACCGHIVGFISISLLPIFFRFTETKQD